MSAPFVYCGRRLWDVGADVASALFARMPRGAGELLPYVTLASSTNRFEIERGDRHPQLSVVLGVMVEVMLELLEDTATIDVVHDFLPAAEKAHPGQEVT